MQGLQNRTIIKTFERRDVSFLTVCFWDGKLNAKFRSYYRNWNEHMQINLHCSHKKEIKSTNVACVVYKVTFPKYLLGLKLGMIFNASFSSGYSITGFNFESDNEGILVAQ